MIKSYHGFIVPITAVVTHNDKTGVYIVYDNHREFKRVKVIYKGEGKAVLDSGDQSKLNEYDTVIINP